MNCLFAILFFFVISTGILLFTTEMVLIYIIMNDEMQSEFANVQISIIISHAVMTFISIACTIITDYQSNQIRKKIKMIFQNGYRNAVLEKLYKIVCCPKFSNKIYSHCGFTFGFTVKFVQVIYLFANIALVRFFIYDLVSSDEKDEVQNQHQLIFYIYLGVYGANFFMVLYKPIIFLITVIILMIVSFLFVIFYIIYRVINKILKFFHICKVQDEDDLGNNNDERGQNLWDYEANLNNSNSINASVGGLSPQVNRNRNQQRRSAARNSRNQQSVAEVNGRAENELKNKKYKETLQFVKKVISQWSKPIDKVKIYQIQEEGGGVLECAICQDKLEAENEKITQLKCNPKHVFHSQCIKKWLEQESKSNHTSCPLCRSDLVQVFNEYQKNKKRRQKLKKLKGSQQPLSEKRVKEVVDKRNSHLPGNKKEMPDSLGKIFQNQGIMANVTGSATIKNISSQQVVQEIRPAPQPLNNVFEVSSEQSISIIQRHGEGDLSLLQLNEEAFARQGSIARPGNHPQINFMVDQIHSADLVEQFEPPISDLRSVGSRRRLNYHRYSYAFDNHSNDSQVTRVQVLQNKPKNTSNNNNGSIIQSAENNDSQ
ncbi:ring finger protein 126 [Stylonychia lemnae]|uniref:Ring finger protein 126 n=1 Tax=Stylonychia lemnae TaxID=5949 RepID=A0A078B8B0_STYLE|nr:ring finger protein 126 [Stylonychia lemnae]|eukprot:CDW89527.1 ring finger protein 126 [Stylonychia lemnae]